jgi:hypothetical protein
MPKAIIEVDKTGTMSINYEGFQGRACDMAENAILQALKNLEVKKLKEDRKDQMIGEALRV